MRPKARLLGVTFGREIRYSHMTLWSMFWYYESGGSFMIHGLFGAEIRGKLPKCLDRVGDSGKIRYLKRYIPKADRG